MGLHVNAGTIILLVLAGAFAVLNVVTLCCVVARRQIQPLLYRAPWLVMASGIGAAVTGVWAIIYLVLVESPDLMGRHNYCTGLAWIVWISYPLTVVPYVLRYLRVYRMHRHKVRAIDETPDVGFWDSVVWTQKQMLGLLFGVVATFALIRMVLDLVKSAHVHVSGFGCSGSFPGLWLTLAYLEVLAGVYIVYKLNVFRDDFEVCRELMQVSACWVLCTLSITVLTIVKHSTSEATFSEDRFQRGHAIVNIVRSVCIFYCTLWAPLWGTRDPQSYLPYWSPPNSLNSLMNLLNDVNGVPYFLHFLSEEMSSNYLCAWMDVELYSDLTDPDQLMNEAVRIYQRYLQHDAECAVPLPRLVRSQVRSRIHAAQQAARNGDSKGAGTLSPQLFAEVERELLRRMEDLFPKFKRSDIGLAFARHIDAEKGQRDALYRSGMLRANGNGVQSGAFGPSGAGGTGHAVGSHSSLGRGELLLSAHNEHGSLPGGIPGLMGAETSVSGSDTLTSSRNQGGVNVHGYAGYGSTVTSSGDPLSDVSWSAHASGADYMW